MRLTQVRVQNYRCVRDTGWFEVEQAKTILVGPNEAGKTAVLEALQRINPPAGVRPLDPLRDYPRKLYNADIQSRKRDPSEIPRRELTREGITSITTWPSHDLFPLFGYE